MKIRSHKGDPTITSLIKPGLLINQKQNLMKMPAFKILKDQRT